METNINLHAPIEPEIGIGNIKLLSNVIHLRDIILNSLDGIIPGTNSQGDWVCDFKFPDWATFSYRGIIKVYSNIYSRLIVRIELNNGYEGTLWGKIRVGSKVSELIDLKPETTFDEELLFVGDNFNVSFSIDYENEIEKIEDIKEKKITQIRREGRVSRKSIIT